MNIVPDRSMRPEDVATPNGLLCPTLPTLKKYGGTIYSWLAIADSQGYVCGACGKLPKTLRLVIDHEHIRGWSKMAPADRWQHVRGLLCWTCNGFRLARGATIANLHGAAEYLERYEARRAAA